LSAAKPIKNFTKRQRDNEKQGFRRTAISLPRCLVVDR
jgi:hypothetical protein